MLRSLAAECISGVSFAWIATMRIGQDNPAGQLALHALSQWQLTNAPVIAPVAHSHHKCLVIARRSGDQLRSHGV